MILVEGGPQHSGELLRRETERRLSDRIEVKDRPVAWSATAAPETRPDARLDFAAHGRRVEPFLCCRFLDGAASHVRGPTQ